MRNPDIRSGPVAESVKGPPAFAGRGRVRALLLMSALCLPACGKDGPRELSAPAPSVAPSASAMPSAYETLKESSKLMAWSRQHADGIELKQEDTRFFMSWDYQDAIRRALMRDFAGGGQEPPKELLGRAEHLVVGRVMERLFEVWAGETFRRQNPYKFRNNYISSVYRHYLNVRYPEVLPGAGEMASFTQDSKAWLRDSAVRETQAWELACHSPFFGLERDPSLATAAEKPLMGAHEAFLAEADEVLGSESEHRYKVIMASLDILLPQMYREAVRFQYEAGGVEDFGSVFDEKEYEALTRKSFTYKAKYFRSQPMAWSKGGKLKALYALVSRKYEELSGATTRDLPAGRQVEPELPKNGATTRD